MGCVIARVEESLGNPNKPTRSCLQYTPTQTAHVNAHCLSYNTNMKLRLTGKAQESDDVWSFFFEPTELLTWTAGQSIRLEIPRKTWGHDERRFTIASGPSEGQIRITTRLSGSEFKQALAALEPGQAIDGYSIEGSFVLVEATQPKLFLAAGIGITPFRAILAEAPVRADIRLLYQSKDQPPVFGDELSAWLGERLRVTPKRLSSDAATAFCPDWQARTVYVSGPEQMVRTIAGELLAEGLPKSQLRTDEFTGDL